jgi:hypothetical protein
MHQRFIRPFIILILCVKARVGRKGDQRGSERHMIKKERRGKCLFLFPNQINHYSKVISNQNPAYGFY